MLEPGNKSNSVRTLPLYARFVCTGNKPNSVGTLPLYVRFQKYPRQCVHIFKDP